jgi:hypothetical protein
MAAALSPQNNYVDNQRWILKFEVKDQVFLKISPMKGLMRFGEKGKLSLRFVGPLKVTQRVGKLAYRIALPPYLAGMHDNFHISMLRKYIPNPDLVVEYEPLEIEEGLTYEEMPVQISDHKEHVLSTKTIPIVKVLWHNHGAEESSWEAEPDVKNRFQHLFEDPMCMVPCIGLSCTKDSYVIPLRMPCFPVQEA